MIAAHGNSLRAVVMYLDKLTPEQILEVNIPTGVPLLYELDSALNVLSKRYLADFDAAH
jgi:2,3-bisphosphoglycerate-dependent phosphoglycerate mutase